MEFESSHWAAASPPGSWPRGDGHRGRASLFAQGGANGPTVWEGPPRWSCHKRAIHSSPERSRADNHGQHEGGLDLRRSLPSQVRNMADLALGAGGHLVEACIGLAVPGRPNQALDAWGRGSPSATNVRRWAPCSMFESTRWPKLAAP